MSDFIQFPPQQLPLSKKTKAWRKQMLDWGSDKATLNNSLIRKSVLHKTINYNLLNGKLDMQDMELIINPNSIKSKYNPSKIQHFPIMNSKLRVLRGEESKRLFDYKAIVTNPTAISEIEENKKQQFLQALQMEVENTAQSDDEYNSKIQALQKYFNYSWQDFREIRCNALLNHYSKEYNMPLIFNSGFIDALTVGEEIYQCDIIGGEPTIERLNPRKVRIYKSGYSNRIEDADVIVIEDYWSPGKIIDTYNEVLSDKDIKYIETLNTNKSDGNDYFTDQRNEFIRVDDDNLTAGDVVLSNDLFWSQSGSPNVSYNSKVPFDSDGNIRVVRMYWKSRRKIKKVKYYDEQGEVQYKLRDEKYVINKALGEEEQILFVNEAWEGTKIGDDIYVNMRPRTVQYNRLSNPSRCHFGIVGSIYNITDDKPYSLVDMMKPFNYLYDAVHDRLNRLIAKNWGKIVQLDLAKVPKGWDIEKWLYFAKNNSLAVVDSFKEGDIGAATGKIVGALNNASSGIIDAELGNSIQQHINLLEFIKMEMSEVVGVTRQREGQISNRETVGGVERATLQSSYITEWLFTIHDDVKKRVLDCFLETAKIAMRGRSKKFQYILSDNSTIMVNIDGDEFAECDYGIVVDNGQGLQELSQKLDMLVQAGIQNQAISFSTAMKLYSSASMAEKQRMIEENEQEIQQRQKQQMQQQQQLQQEQLQATAEQQEAQRNFEDSINQRDNETKLMIAQINAEAKLNDIQEPVYSEEAKANLLEKMRQFDAKLKLDREKLNLDRKKQQDATELKRKSLAKKINTK